MEVLPIKHEECAEWLLKIHYAKRIPLIMHSFGLYVDKKLDGIITYGLPASPALCVGVNPFLSNQAIAALALLSLPATASDNSASFTPL